MQHVHWRQEEVLDMAQQLNALRLQHFRSPLDWANHQRLSFVCLPTSSVGTPTDVTGVLP